MKTHTTGPIKMHRAPLLLAVIAGLASLLIPAAARAGLLYAPAQPGDSLYVGTTTSVGVAPNHIEQFTTGGVGSSFANTGISPIGVAFDTAGNLYVSA